MDPSRRRTMKIHVGTRCGRVPLSRADVVRLARRVAPPEWDADAEVEVIFVDDEAISALNRRFLGRRGPTDVIAFSFDASEEMGDDKTIGCVVVSAETARNEARRRGADARDELALYVVHGLLHLAGCDDAKPQLRREMRKREKQALAAAGFNAPSP